jgi:hypothetical protein
LFTTVLDAKTGYTKEGQIRAEFIPAHAGCNGTPLTRAIVTHHLACKTTTLNVGQKHQELDDSIEEKHLYVFVYSELLFPFQVPRKIFDKRSNSKVYKTSSHLRPAYEVKKVPTQLKHAVQNTNIC